MLKKDPALERVIADLETVFQKALSAENFSAALKAKELLAKIYGFFEKPSLKPLKEWSEKELELLLQELEMQE